MPNHLAFCTGCGSPLAGHRETYGEASQSRDQNPGLRCDSCGTQAEPHEVFCGACGGRLGRTTGRGPESHAGSSARDAGSAAQTSWTESVGSPASGARDFNSWARKNTRAIILGLIAVAALLIAIGSMVGREESSSGSLAGPPPTEALPAVENLEVLNTGRSLIVSFDAPPYYQGTRAQYEIQYRSADEWEWIDFERSDPTSKRAEISPDEGADGGDFFVRVRAGNDAGMGAWSIAKSSGDQSSGRDPAAETSSESDDAPDSLIDLLTGCTNTQLGNVYGTFVNRLNRLESAEAAYLNDEISPATFVRRARVRLERLGGANRAVKEKCSSPNAEQAALVRSADRVFRAAAAYYNHVTGEIEAGATPGSERFERLLRAYSRAINEGADEWVKFASANDITLNEPEPVDEASAED